MSTGSSSRRSGRTKGVERIPLTRYLRYAVLCGLGFAIPFALVPNLFLAYVTGLPVLLSDTLILQAWFLIVALPLFTVLAFILWLPGVAIDRLLKMRGKDYGLIPVYTIVFSVPVVVIILLTGWIIIDRPFDFRSPWFIPVLVLFCVAGILVGIMLKETAMGVRRLFRGSGTGKAVRIFLLFACIPLVVSAAIYIGTGLREMRRGEVAVPSTLHEETGTRMVIIGLDGATWDIMSGMIAQGKLPNIKYLMDNGSYGPLTSNISMMKGFTNSASMGMRSPALWESIATGKKEKKHGIFDFEVMRVPFMQSDLPFRFPLLEDILPTIPTTSTIAKSLTFWDILSRAGIDVGVIGWWNLWPVAPVEHGYVISSRVQWKGEATVYPPDLLKDYPEEEFFNDEKMYKLFLNLWEGLDKDSLLTILQSSDARLNLDSFKRHYRRDNYIAALSEHMLKTHPTPLFATYFWGPDFVSHLFWKYMEPSYFADVREEDARLFGNIITSYYSFLDEVVGKHIEADSLDATYLICSDHGFGVWEEEGTSSLEQLSGRLYHPTYSGKHRQNGIIIMAGKNIKRGVDLSGSTLFDITPTILTLFGMPVAIDMDGRPLMNVIENGFLEAHPVRYINTYESGQKKVPRAVASSMDEEIKDRLRALGYLN